MVAGHAEAPFSHFIYLFHMAVFYIISGYLYSEKNGQSLKSLCGFIRRKLKGLWLPFFICSTIFAVLNNVLLKVEIYTDNNAVLNYVSSDHIVIHSMMSVRQTLLAICRCIFFSNDSELGGAFWFLRDLFFISVCYCLFSFIVRKLYSIIGQNDNDRISIIINIVQLLVTVGLFIAGYFFSVNDIKTFGVGKVESCYSLFYVGHLFSSGRCKKFFQGLSNKKWAWIIAVTFCCLLALNNLGSISLANNRYGNPGFLFACSLCGWLWMYGIAHIICKVKEARWMKGIYHVILYTGQHTLIIVLLHFLAFKIGNLISCIYYQYPNYCIAAFPTLCGGIGVWWILYTIIGTAVPLLVYWLYAKVKYFFSIGG